MEDLWIKAPLTLYGETVDLISLEENHIPALVELAQDKRIWQFYAVKGSDSAKLVNSLKEALIERERGGQFPFIILDKRSRKVIGSSRFLNIQPEHKKVEIGWTWLHPNFWGKGINTECKLLLLTYCFENLNTMRVQLKTDENNIRSRKAIEKIGAQFEGLFRNDMIRHDSTKRNSVYYSIIDQDWTEAKQKLIAMLTRK
jgi:N-acetyltransferase